MADAPPKNTAFDFIKPHANTEATKAMVTELLGVKVGHSLGRRHWAWFAV